MPHSAMFRAYLQFFTQELFMVMLRGNQDISGIYEVALFGTWCQTWVSCMQGSLPTHCNISPATWLSAFLNSNEEGAGRKSTNYFLSPTLLKITSHLNLTVLLKLFLHNMLKCNFSWKHEAELNQTWVFDSKSLLYSSPKFLIFKLMVSEYMITIIQAFICIPFLCLFSMNV